ncbi:hypothetical protein Trco_006851 [Trichoderma cornu-damae]|uniref:Uncharacterized protein n=1 Tax=Trichoderma cornu-damae TaxID=654480 RepID=A0A9P8QHJ5_9HYPO|nr:hypothetical protein Trco_006851 [Trichoderma cornu-damae]
MRTSSRAVGTSSPRAASVFPWGVALQPRPVVILMSFGLLKIKALVGRLSVGADQGEFLENAVCFRQKPCLALS